jgi:hypothetical protein
MSFGILAPDRGELSMYCEWNASNARERYVFKILGTWIAAIAVAAFPVIIALNAVTL